MRAGWLGYVVFVWFVVLFLSSVTFGASFTSNETMVEPAQSSQSFIEVWTEEDWGTLVSPMNFPGYFSDIVDMVTLQNSFLHPSQHEDPGLTFLYWLIVAPIVATLVFALIILFVSILERAL
jgi:hypothetical protein